MQSSCLKDYTSILLEKHVQDWTYRSCKTLWILDQLSVRISCCFTQKYFSLFKINQVYSWLTIAWINWVDNYYLVWYLGDQILSEHQLSSIQRVETSPVLCSVFKPWSEYQTSNRLNIGHRKLVYGLFVHIKSVFEQWINYRPCDWYSNNIHLIVLNKDTKIVWVSNSSRLPPSNFQILTVC